ncbi:MAG TPA: hypothetical protein VGJ83_01135 [Gemmatimonadales bacterium]|jgi:hypothetical protein
MKATTPALLLAAALLSTACGEGRAIFNVDVYSFMAGTGSDTVPYAIPPATSATASSPAKEINLPPGFGSSVIDSVHITGTANLVNTAGTGTIGFRMYLDSTSAGTLNPSALAINLTPVNVSGNATAPMTIVGDLSGALKTLFTRSSLWVRVEIIGNNPGAVPVTGNMVLTALQLRVVIQDKLF